MWGARRIVFGLAAASMLLAVACGGGAAKPPAGDADGIRDHVVAAMADIGSYHVEFSIDGQDGTWAFDYVAPDSYRVLLSFGKVTGTSPGRECYVLPDGETPGCDEVDPHVSDTLLSESIYFEDKLYSRECASVDSGCGGWETHDRRPMVGPSPIFLPEWPLVAIEMAQLKDAASDGDNVVLRGTVNHLRAILENNRRVAEASGITTFGSECHDVTTIPGPDGTRPAPAGSRECHELTFEESLKQQEPDLSFFDDVPSRIEIAVSPDRSQVRSVVIDAAAPPGHEPSDAVHLVVTYSKFNEVTIEAPE